MQHCGVKRRMPFHTQYTRINGIRKRKLSLKSTIRFVSETETRYGGLVFEIINLNLLTINHI
jgi:hypothetical protein